MLTDLVYKELLEKSTEKGDVVAKRKSRARKVTSILICLAPL